VKSRFIGFDGFEPDGRWQFGDDGSLMPDLVDELRFYLARQLVKELKANLGCIRADNASRQLGGEDCLHDA
jgi:hypothetical protein